MVVVVVATAAHCKTTTHTYNCTHTVVNFDGVVVVVLLTNRTLRERRTQSRRRVVALKKFDKKKKPQLSVFLGSPPPCVRTIDSIVGTVVNVQAERTAVKRVVGKSYFNRNSILETSADAETRTQHQTLTQWERFRGPRVHPPTTGDTTTARASYRAMSKT